MITLHFIMVHSIIPPHLPREYLDALHKFLDYKSKLNVKSNAFSPSIDDDCFMSSGFTDIYSGKVKLSQIPSGNGWKWSQSKGRKKIPIPSENMIVDVFKITPRKLKDEKIGLVPSLKMWILHIQFDATCNSILWCEKGLDPTKNELDFIASLLCV